MDKLTICRICLIGNVNMHCIVDVNLHEVYEKLTEIPFETKNRPLQVCYICRERLRNSYNLQTICRKSEEMFIQMLENNELKLKPLQDANILTISEPIVHASIAPTRPNNVNNEDVNVNPIQTLNMQIKEEIFEDHCNTEDNAGIEHYEFEIKKELPLELENYNNDTMWRPIQGNTIETFIPVTNKSMLTALEEKSPSITTNKLQTQLWLQHSMKTLSARKRIIQPKSYNEKPYKCTTCGKCFGQKKHLISHTRIHSGDKQYQCEVCQKCFSRGSYLKVHRRLHTEDKPHKCEICGKSYNDKYNFVNHLRAHNNEKPYQCDICKKCFSCKRHLISHIRTHNSERAFKCNICHKRFHAKHNLNAHIRIHTGEKPYKCTKCDKAFRQKQHLSGHFRIHTGEKPYKCEICDKCFQRKSYLMDHAHRHTGQKSHKCDKCDKSFSSKRNLIRHICAPTNLNETKVKCEYV